MVKERPDHITDLFKNLMPEKKFQNSLAIHSKPYMTEHQPSSSPAKLSVKLDTSAILNKFKHVIFKKFQCV